MSTFKPMLAYTIEGTSKILYPCFVSLKLDGIRVVILDGVVMSRSLKPIRSKAVQEMFGHERYNGLDGEILYGDWNAPNVFNLTTQTVMATELKREFSKDELRMAVFDDFLCGGSYEGRYRSAGELVEDGNNLTLLTQHIVYNEQELLEFERKALEDGYEGIMIRSINGPYKQGRSTQKEGTIGKLKRFSDDEALIIGFEEKLTNTNEKLKNELGYSQRSQAQEGMVGAGTLGAFVCECKGVKFTCGSGLDDSTRQLIWDNREEYLGKFIKFKYFAVGMLDSYRFPIFLGFRHEDDL